LSLGRAGLRLVWKRRLETVVLVLLVAGIVASYGGIVVLKENIAEQVYLQTLQSMGHILVAGYFTPEDARALETLPGVAEVRLYPIWFGTTIVEGDKILIPLAGESAANALVVFDVYEGRMPEAGDEAVYYHSLSTPPGMRVPELRVGDTVWVVVQTPRGVENRSFTIVGLARGYAFLGGAPQSLVVKDEVVLDITGGEYTMISIVAADQSPEAIDRLAEEVRALLEERGVQVFYFFVNKKENNPVVAIFEGGLRMLDMLAQSSLALAAVIPAALGAAQVAREARMIAVLKSIGVGPMGLARLYALPWMVRAGIGALLGALAAPQIARVLLERVVIGDNEIAQIVFSYTPFNPYWGTVARTSLTALAAVALAAMIPVALAWRVDEASALRFVGIRGAARIRLPSPSLRLAIHLRETASRPWRLAGLALAFATIAAVAGAAGGLVDSVYSVADYYEYESAVDLYVFAVSAAPEPPVPVWERLVSLAPEGSRYAVYAQYDYVNALGIGERFRFKALLAGDPGLSAPLLEGRYPETPGEVVVTKSIALLLGVGVGDSIVVNVPAGGSVEARIVGVTSSMENLGFTMIVYPGDYEDIVGLEPGRASGVLELDLPEGVDPEEEGRRLVAELERDPLLNASFMTRQDVAGMIRSFARILYGVLAAVGGVVALLALVSVAGLILVDLEARRREQAVYQAIGLPPSWTATGAALLAGVAALIAGAAAYPAAVRLADAIARASAAAIGYFEPAVPRYS